MKAVDIWSRLGRQGERARVKRQRESRVMGDMLAGAGALAGAFLTGYLFPGNDVAGRAAEPRPAPEPADDSIKERAQAALRQFHQQHEDPMPLIPAVDQMCKACHGTGSVEGALLGERAECLPCNGTGRVADPTAERRALQSILGAVLGIERQLERPKADPYRSSIHEHTQGRVEIAEALETISKMAAAIDGRLEKLEAAAEGLSDDRVVVLTAEFTHSGDLSATEHVDNWSGGWHVPECEIEAIRLIMEQGTVFLQNVSVGCWPLMNCKLHSDLLVKPVALLEKRKAAAYAGQQPIVQLRGNGSIAKGHVVLYGRWVDPQHQSPCGPPMFRTRHY